MSPYDNASGSGIGSEDSGVPPMGGYVTIRRLDELAEAKAYLDRIGARATGPWSAAIHEERDGYEIDRSSVKLEYEIHGRTASITGMKYWGEDPDLAPTDDERAAILEASKNCLWPYPFWRYGLGHDLPEDMAEALRTGNIYIFYDGERDPRTCYVQTYHPGVTGRGKYRSWVHISTQEWISGQPQELPLYGLDQVGKMAEGIARVFIHEGPKAAEMVKRYLDPDREDNRLDHPWAEFLATGIHIGWPGGGDRYRKVDWSPLQHAKLKGLPVVVVADNDKVGVEAAEAISEEHIPGNPEVLYHLALEAKLIPHPAAQWLSSCFETAAFAAQRAKRDAAVSKSPGGSPLWLPDPDENFIDRARAALEKFANDPGFSPEVVQIADHPRRERPQLSLRFGSMVIAFRLREAA